MLFGLRQRNRSTTAIEQKYAGADFGSSFIFA